MQPPIDEIITLVNLNSKVISQMAELDPDPFWVENQTSLLIWETPFEQKKVGISARDSLLQIGSSIWIERGQNIPFSGNFAHCAKNIHKTDPKISEMFYCLSFIFRTNLMDRDWYKVTYCY